MISSILKFSNTIFNIWGKQSLFSPPTVKQAIRSPSITVSLRSHVLWSGDINNGGCWIGKGGGTANNGSYRGWWWIPGWREVSWRWWRGGTIWEWEESWGSWCAGSGGSWIFEFGATIVVNDNVGDDETIRVVECWLLTKLLLWLVLLLMTRRSKVEVVVVLVLVLMDEVVLVIEEVVVEDEFENNDLLKFKDSFGCCIDCCGNCNGIGNNGEEIVDNEVVFVLLVLELVAIEALFNIVPKDLVVEEAFAICSKIE